MPRTSPYSIDLAEAERTELEARARRYTSSYSEVVRARIVLYAAEGLEQRRDRRTPRHAAASRLQMAQTLLRPASGRIDRSASGRTAPEFFPLTSWSPLRRWPANSRRRPTSPSRWLAGSAPIWPAPPSSKASPPRSRAPRSGAGSATDAITAFHSGFGAKNSPVPYHACGENVLMSRARGDRKQRRVGASSRRPSAPRADRRRRAPRCRDRAFRRRARCRAPGRRRRSTGTVGMFVASDFHVAPPSFEKCTPRACASTSTRGFVGCSRIRLIDVSGRPAESERHVAPKSSLTKTYGL